MRDGTQNLGKKPFCLVLQSHDVGPDLLQRPQRLGLVEGVGVESGSYVGPLIPVRTQSSSLRWRSDIKVK